MNNKHTLKLVIGKDLDEKYISMIAERFPGLDIVKITDEEEQEREITDTDILMTRILPKDPSIAPKLKWVQFIWEGVDRMTDEFRKSDIILTNAGGAHSVHMAEHAFTYMLNFSRKTRLYEKYQERNEWLGWEDQPILQRLAGSTIGIIGYGRIGRAIARIARGFDMNVLALKKNPMKRSIENYHEDTRCDVEGELPDRIFGPGDILEMLPLCDHVVLTTPLTSETKGSFGAEELRSMKKTAFFINIGRGEVVVEDDLIRALDEGWIAGAGLDVFSKEPLRNDSPLWSMENVLITPHSSVGGDPADDRIVCLFMVNLEKFFNGENLLNMIDKQRGY